MWVGDGDGPAWLTGGTYLLTRRIRMRIENWDRTTLLEQERVIGRQKGSGAPNGLQDEFEELDFDMTDAKGKPMIDVDAHVRLVSPQNLGGIEILRRGYNFTDGTDGFGHLDAGLFFIAFVRSPRNSSSPCSARCPVRMRSTSTSPTPAQPSSPARRVSPRVTPLRIGVRRCSREFFLVSCRGAESDVVAQRV